jgi:hypothetical protein
MQRVLSALSAIAASIAFSAACAEQVNHAERLFRAKLSGPESYIIEAVMYSDRTGAHPFSLESVEAWCADLCLKGGGGLYERNEAYTRALESAGSSFEPLAKQIMADGSDTDGDSRSRRLNEALQTVFREADVYRFLSAYIEASRDDEESCLASCVEGTLRAHPASGELEPWQKLVSACTANVEQLDRHIVMHPDDPTLIEGYRRGGRLLLENDRFHGCLSASIRRHPELEEAVTRLYVGTTQDFLSSIRRGVWMIWERDGVKRIVEEAAREHPDLARIESLLDACLAGKSLEAEIQSLR